MNAKKSPDHTQGRPKAFPVVAAIVVATTNMSENYVYMLPFITFKFVIFLICYFDSLLSLSGKSYRWDFCFKL